ncbi:hypothetical protein GCM10028857_09480 [Salinarchaeum chitinilyticum]
MDSHEVRRQWAERSGEYSPDYYAYYGPDDTSESVRSILDRTLDRTLDHDARILELGCSSGRHLAHLREGGYHDLAGIEVNDDAFDVMAETYPELAETGTFYHDAIEAVVEGFPDGHFDAVYSVETLQHIHPDAEWVFDELVRITDDLLITIENEGEGSETTVNYVDDGVPLYYRDWSAVFDDDRLSALDLTEAEQTTVHEGDTVRAFRKNSSE